MSEKEQARLKELVEVYEELCRVPVPVAGRIIAPLGGQNGPKTIQVSSQWSSRNCQLNKSILTQRFSTFSSDKLELLSTFSAPLVNLDAQLLAYSPDDKFCASLFTVGNGNGKKQIICITENGVEKASYDVTTQKKHGMIHTKGDFSCFKWSPDSKKLVYIAEKSQKSAEFFEDFEKLKVDKESGEILTGKKFEHNEDWGEGHTEVKNPQLCFIEVGTGNIEVLEIPNIAPIQVHWIPDTTVEAIALCGIKTTPFKLGKAACNNRVGSLFTYDLETKSLTLVMQNVSIDGFVINPYFSTEMFYFCREPNGPHNTTLEFRKTYLNDPSNTTIIKPAIREPAFDGFSGFTNVTIPDRCWANNNKCLVFSSIETGSIKTLAINLACGEIDTFSSGHENASEVVLDVHNNYAIIMISSSLGYTRLVMAKIGPDSKFTVLSESSKEMFTYILPYSYFDHIDLEYTVHSMKFEREGQKYHGILFLPNQEKFSGKLPLIVAPHGGPHGCSMTSLPRYGVRLKLAAGYAVLQVNYHGSASFGDDFVRSLLGKVGDIDVEDVHYAVLSTLEKEPRLDNDRILAYGLSHGGFIVSHLVARYPDIYKACVAANPILDISMAMHYLTDIPDWAPVEALGHDPDFSKPISSAELVDMYEKSPISVVDKINSPYMLIYGGKDRRVPAHHDPFMRNLQARDVPCKVYYYPEANHRLEDMTSETDAAINVILWFDKHAAK